MGKCQVFNVAPHVSKQQLDSYVDEFQFRFNNRSMGDGERMVRNVKGAEGKRLIHKNATKH